jgi:chromosome segregation protein
VYLKRLDVHGFKSFANKTQLQFAPGVTCIIGPNGCGKTNVADSIRWVLGEHASRTLRARKTEDVIFAGSDKRAPMGMGEVSIALDNSRHWLPIEFDEVVVSRRAYRSGENEYLINGSKVRLRDVVELFMRAQVGQNSYAFMGQGMVEQVLSLRPEDRRALIEEAADVRLYRQKLEDAQKKLKETRENVDRVRMLVREIEPRINQLERQAGRAVKYRELAQELAATLHVYYAHQWQEVNDKLLAAITTHDQRAEQFQQVQGDAKALEDGLTQLRGAIDERKREIAERERLLRTLEDYARDLERRVALDTERGAMLAARVGELTGEIASLRAGVAEQEREAPIADTSELEARLEAARAELAAHRDRLDAIDHELAGLQRSAMTHEQEAARAQVTVEDLARRVTEAADAVARLRRERDAAVEERRKLLNEEATRRDEHAGLQAEAAAVSDAVERAIDERNQEIEMLALYRQHQRVAEEELRTLRVQIEKAAARLEIIEELDVRPQAPDAGIRAVLEAAGHLPRELTAPDMELRGVVGLVHQLVRSIPPGLEQALGVALAENYYAVVFERETDMHAAVKFLLENDFGRVTMFALDAFQEHRPLHLIKERGVIGVASGMVRCDSRHRKLIDTLLGRTVVVENLDLARRYVRRGLASAVATVDGVLVRPLGSMLAGAPLAERAVFAVQRDMGELPEELSRLRPLVEEKEAALDEAIRRQAEAQRRIDALAAKVEEARERRAQLDTRAAAANAELAACEPRVRALAESIEKSEAQITELQAARQRDEAESAAKAAAARDAAAREQQERARLASLEQERAPLLPRVSELAAQVAHLDGELRTERSATQGERIAIERLRRLIAQKEEQQAKARQETQAVGSRLGAARRELGEKTAEVEALRSDLDPARQELAQLESRERSMTAQLAESNEKLRSAERALVDAENEVRIRREELETLRQTLETEGFVATAEGEVQRLPDPEPRQDSAPAEAFAPARGDPPSWMRTGDGPDLPPVRGGSAVDAAELRDRIAELRGQIRGLGPINEEAASEYGESRERYDYLTAQLTDLTVAEEELLGAVGQLDREIREKFRETFKLVNAEFERYFSAFFRGGTARLELGEVDEEGLPGIEIYAQPPGKKLGSLALLSGGERSLTAVALLFALLQANPSPICVLDEVDAALDEANVGRFVEELRALAEKTQFIIITHNRRTIENADTIYGVSMGADSVSRVLGLRLDEVKVADD